MTGELIVFGVLAIGLLTVWALVADAVRERKLERAEDESRRRVRREYETIVQKRPGHIVEMSRWLTEREDDR